MNYDFVIGIEYLIPISFTQQKQDAPAGPSKRFLMRHPENMRTNGAWARSGQNTEPVIINCQLSQSQPGIIISCCNCRTIWSCILKWYHIQTTPAHLHLNNIKNTLETHSQTAADKKYCHCTTDLQNLVYTVSWLYMYNVFLPKGQDRVNVFIQYSCSMNNLRYHTVQNAYIDID